MERGRRYPAEAYNDKGVLWWEMPSPPRRGPRAGTLGAEKKIAAWLYFNKALGEKFTMPELRRAIGEPDRPNADEHTNRRFRKLRAWGWVVPSHATGAGLGVGEYRLLQTGWHPGSGAARPKTAVISAATRRRVFERDGFRCKLCGVGDGEAYPDRPGSAAVLTVGHRRPGARQGSDDLDNLRTECADCNQPTRDEHSDPETMDEVWAPIKRLPREEKEKLLAWLTAGERGRSRVDELYDRARKLSPSEIDMLRDHLRAAVG